MAREGGQGFFSFDILKGDGRGVKVFFGVKMLKGMGRGRCTKFIRQP